VSDGTPALPSKERLAISAFNVDNKRIEEEVAWYYDRNQKFRDFFPELIKEYKLENT
jgi:hypothetical protein